MSIDPKTSELVTVYRCVDCPEHREERDKSIVCSRTNREVPVDSVPYWCPLGTIEDMVTSRPKLEG